MSSSFTPKTTTNLARSATCHDSPRRYRSRVFDETSSIPISWSFLRQTSLLWSKQEPQSRDLKNHCPNTWWLCAQQRHGCVRWQGCEWCHERRNSQRLCPRAFDGAVLDGSIRHHDQWWNRSKLLLGWRGMNLHWTTNLDFSRLVHFEDVSALEMRRARRAFAPSPLLLLHH